MPPPPPPQASSTARALRNHRNRPAFLRDIIIIRLINAWWIATFFQPDEFFQSLEPAWRLAFGAQSGAWLTWEWHHQLRSSLHPAIFSAAYLIADLIAKLLPQGSAFRAALLIAAPKTLQAIFAGVGDWYTWQLAVKIYGHDSNVSFFALFLQLFSPWQWYCSTRTFSNSLETTLTVMALYHWPWQLLGTSTTTTTTTTKENTKPVNALRNASQLRLSLCLAALAVVLRPTNVLIWATVAAVTLTRVTLRGASPLTLGAVGVLLREAVLCGGFVVALSAVSDRLYFGFWTFPPYNWLNFNISRSLAVFYGRNPWHYYLLQGLPLLCTTSLPFALQGLYNPSDSTDSSSSIIRSNILKTLSYTVFTTIGALSLISHKEVRFIYPLLPALNILAAPFAASFFTSPPDKSSKAIVARPRIRRKPYIIAALGVNIVLAGYLSFLHQPAPLTVLNFLRRQYEHIHPASVWLAHETHQPAQEPRDELFALFLMPCHSTPWRSHLVYPGLDAYALSCDPPLHTQPDTPERDNYRDEADRFYDDPIGFLRTELFVPSSMRAPRYIVGFEGIKPWLLEFLQTPEGKALGMQLTQVWAGFNGFFNEDSRRTGKMIVWDTGLYSPKET